MSVETKVDAARRLVHHRLVGEVTADELMGAIVGQLAVPGFSPDFSILWEIEPGATRQLFARDALSLRGVVQELGAQRGQGRTAMVAFDETDYGMARMMQQLLLREHTRPLQVFRTLDEALRWLFH